LRTVKSRYLRDICSTDFDEIWHGDAKRFVFLLTNNATRARAVNIVNASSIVPLSCIIFNIIYYLFIIGWLGSRVVSMLDSGAEGPGSNRSRDAVG